MTVAIPFFGYKTGISYGATSILVFVGRAPQWNNPPASVHIKHADPLSDKLIMMAPTAYWILRGSLQTDHTAIEVSELSKKYGYTYALRNIALQVAHGEVSGLLGPNGSGKTTHLKVLATLTSPTSSHSTMYRRNLKEDGRELRQMIGYVAYDPLLYRDFSGEENIHFYSKFHRRPSSEKLQRNVDVAHNLLKIPPRQHEPVKNLSSGLRKRFDLVRTILHDPRILLLDEPSSGIDMQTNDILHDFIRGIPEKTTVEFSTHDLDQAQRISDQVAVSVEGTLCHVLNSQDLTDTGIKTVFEKKAS